MKRVVLFLNGHKPSKKRVLQTLKKTDTVIGVDGGTKHALAFGITPDVVIGDWDSLSKKTRLELEKKNVKIVSFPSEKDETDSELALRYVVKEGFKEIVLFGVSGDRIDHFLANMTLFASIAITLMIHIIEVKQDIYFVKDHIVITGKKGDTVSLLPLLSDVTGVTTSGLQWQLQNETLYRHMARGISNVMLGKKAEIRVAGGVLLVIHTLGKP